MALTQSDVQALFGLLTDSYMTGDRGGFYLHYYNLIKDIDQNAAEQVLLQAQITTYSGFIGGAALLGNGVAKFSNPDLYDLSLDDFSYRIARALYDAISADVAAGGTGILTQTEIQFLDSSVWTQLGLGDYFPGNIQLWSEDLNFLFSEGSLSAALAAYQLVFGARLGFTADDYSGAEYHQPNTDHPDYTVIRRVDDNSVVHIEAHVGALNNPWVDAVIEEPSLILAAAIAAVIVEPVVGRIGLTLLTLVGAVNQAAGDALGHIVGDAVESIYTDSELDFGLRTELTRFLGANGEEVDPDQGFPEGIGWGDFPIILRTEGTFDDSNSHHILTAFQDAEINGAGGEDLLIGFDNSVLSGGADDDLLIGKMNAMLSGDAGKDVLFGIGETVLDGGLDDDIIFAFDDVLAKGGAGDDIILGTGKGSWDGGAGNDLLATINPDYLGSDDRLELDGGAGDDTIISLGGDGPLVHGGAGDDWIFVWSFAAEVYGDGGADTFFWAPDILIADAEAQDRLSFFGFTLTGGIAIGGEEVRSVSQSFFPFIRYGFNDAGELVVSFAGEEMYVADFQSGPHIAADDLGISLARIEFDFRNLFDPRSSLQASPLGDIINAILKGMGVLLPEDPLALDLDGDGLEFSGLATSETYFDLDGDGFAERTGWLRSDDGFLALDRDGDGAIGDIGELFGAPGVSGFAELSDLDSNGDGIIDALDAQFSELRVWRDLNQDGVSNADELFTLGELDIVSIDLNSTVINVTTSSDHILHAESTFTRGDGTQGSVYDVLLDASQFDTRYLGDAGTADWAANVPDLKGYGLLTDLKVAASNDLAVAQALAQVSGNLNVVDLQALVAASEPLLLAWNDANTSSAELTAVLVQSDAGGAQWLDYGVYHEDAQGGYWSLASGNSVLDGGGVAIARPSLEDLLAQTPGANQAWRLEQMWSPERNAVLGDRPTAPYKVALDANGQVTVLDHGIYNEDAQGGYWTLASGTAVLDSMGAAIVRPTLQDVLAQTAADGTAWRVESFAEPEAAALVESFAIFYLNGNAVDYSVYVNDPMGGYWASAQAVADAVALGQPAPAGATHADLASFVVLYLAQPGTSVTSHEIVDADKARYALKTGGAALSDLDNLVATIDPVEGLVYAQNVAQQSGFLQDVLERYEFWGEAVAVRLASQTGLASFFQGVVYDAAADVFQATTSRELIPLYEAIFAAAPGDAQGAQDYLRDWREILSVVYADFKRNGRGAMSESLVFANVVAAHESTGIAMGVIPAAEELGVSSQNIFHDNTDGATVEGTGGNDIFYLSSGNQTFRGGRGGDVYVVGKNFGQDVIEDIEPEFGGDDPDLVRFADIQSTEVSARREGIDLILTVDATGDELRIAQQFEGRNVVPISGDVSLKTGVTEIAFADGVVWDRVDMAWAVADPQPTSDLIEGTRDFDVLDGGAGNDTLRGGVDSDLYVFKLGYGQDRIEDEDDEIFTDHTDMVMFGEGITKDDLVFQRNGQSTTLEILVGTAGDSLTISQQFSSAYPGVFQQQWFHRIELFTFDDGSYYNWDDIMVKMVADGKTEGDDTIYGFDYDDRLDGGAGNDSLNGGNDSDTYIFGRGYGQDIVYDQVTRVLSGDNDRVIFQDGITQADVVLSRAGTDLIFDLIGTTDRLTIRDNFGANNLGMRLHDIEEFRFADGSSWNTFDVQQILLQSTDGDDSLLGFFSNDTLDGGLGNDTLIGGNGADTYVFDVGYGSDIIDDETTSIFAKGPDILQLGASITAADIALSRTGHKLGDLILTLTATGDQLTILDQFATNNLGSRLDEVEEIRFADGTVWDRGDLQNQLINQGATAGDDTLVGFFGVDILDGGAGNDRLLGENGGDIYVFGTGYGSDVIFDNATSIFAQEGDQVTFTDEIAPADLILTRQGDDLIVDLVGSSDRLRIEDQFLWNNLGSRHYEIESFAFADGTVWNAYDIQLITLEGTAGDDVIHGFYGSDTLDGGAGNDSLFGDDGSDTYIFDVGYGQDEIHDLVTSIFAGESDRVVFGPGIAPADLALARQGDDLFITVAATDDSLRIVDQFWHRFSRVENFEFDDGTVWSYFDLTVMLTQGTAGDDSIVAFETSNTIDGLAGNDTINGGNGNDTITGGLGDDSLLGGNHNDTYFYTRGDGHDVIVEEQNFLGTYGGTADLLVLQGVAPSDVSLVRNGSDATLIIAESAPGAGDGGSILLKYSIDEWYDSGIDQISFDDGTLWTRADLRAMWLAEALTAGDDSIDGFTFSEAIDSGAGNDTIRSARGNDTLTGGEGNDSLVGGFHNDTYIYARGDGHDVIVEEENRYSSDPGGTADRLVLQGIAPSELILERNGNDAILVIPESAPGAGDNGSIVLKSNFDEWFDRGIDEIVFDDGTTWVRGDLRLLWLTQAATAGDDVIDGFNTRNEISGLAGNDTLNGHSGDDTLIGGAGNDSLVGGDHNDTYVYARGDGHDVIVEGEHRWNKYGGTADRLVLQGILHTEVTVQRNGSDVTLVIAESVPGIGDDGSILLKYGIEEWYNRGVEEIVFDDGTIWTRADLRVASALQGATAGDDVINGFNIPDVINGLAGNDTINAGDGNDTLTGGLGNDSLVGGYHNDTYVYARGDGHDVIVEGRHVHHWYGGTADRLVLQGIAPSEITLQRSGNHATLVIAESSPGAGDGGSIVLRDNFDEWEHRGVDAIAFDDGTTWARVDLRLMWLAQAPTAGDDVIDGFNTWNEINGFAGNDTINGFSGNDTIIGGLGDDSLSGGYHNDTYIYTRGDGHDVIVEGRHVHHWYGGTADRLVLQGIAPSEITLQRSGNHATLVIAESSPGAGDGGSIVLRDNFDEWEHRGVDEIAFDDGTVWSRADLRAVWLAQAPTVGDDSISGFNSHDLVEGGAGNDTLNSGSGNDTLIGGAGADALNGGDGVDTASYAGSIGGATVNLAIGAASGGDATGDSLSSIESLIGSDHGDNLAGNAGVNRLEGGAGDDTLVGGAGGDQLLGDAGLDTASYAGSTAGVTIDLSAGAASGGYADGDTFTGIENLIGSDHADSLTGDAGANRLEGGAGADTLSGGLGDDSYVFGRGGGVDIVSDAGGTDRILFDAGLTGEDVVGEVVGGVLHIGIKATPGDLRPASQLPDRLVIQNWQSLDQQIEIAEFADGSVLSLAEVLQAGNAKALVEQGQSVRGNLVPVTATMDSYQLVTGPSHGVLSIDVSSGIFTFAADAAYLGMDAFTVQVTSTLGGITSSETVTVGIEIGDGTPQIASGTAGHDALSGGGGNDVFDGLEGDDVLSGGAGDDSLTGGAGNDLLQGGSGTDELIGGDGVDTTSYIGSSAAVTVDLGTGAASGGHAQGDILIGIENLIGSGHGDSLTGDALTNRLEGGDGADTLSGGAGDDTLVGGLGADLLDGGDGIDTVSYAQATEGLRVHMAVPSINSGAASGDRYVSIENVIGSAFNDAIYGNIAENALYGGDGDDRFFSLYSGDSVYGGAGDDRFYSRSGNTHFDGGDGDDTVVYTAVNTSVVTDLAAGIGSFDNSQHTLTGIESASGGRAGDELLGTTGANTFEGNDGNDSLVGREGNDTLSGGAGDDTLWGGADDDMLWGGSGADLIHGEAGVDTASYAFSSAAVTVDLLAGTAIGGDAQGDTLNHIENLIGSDHADSLTGDTGANRFEGGAGADTLSGGAGDDRYAYALGDGDDAIDNAETAPATADDRLLFGQGLDSDDLWFTQDGDDLLVQILDDQRGSLRIQDWYAAGSTGDAAKLDAFETSAGAVLVEQNVQQLVDAMAGLPAGGGDVVDNYKDQVPASVSTAIAAAWQ